MAKNLDESVQGEEFEMDSGPRVYELGFHLDPELPTEEVKKAYQAVRGTVTGKGTLVAEGEPEQIQLAYTISRQETTGRRDFTTAHFAWIAYEATPSDHTEIIAAAGAEKRIIRFIDVVTTKDAARHAVEMRELAAKTPAPREEGTEVASTELDTALESVI